MPYLRTSNTHTSYVWTTLRCSRVNLQNQSKWNAVIKLSNAPRRAAYYYTVHRYAVVCYELRLTSMVPITISTTWQVLRFKIYYKTVLLTVFCWSWLLIIGFSFNIALKTLSWTDNSNTFKILKITWCNVYYYKHKSFFILINI